MEAKPIAKKIEVSQVKKRLELKKYSRTINDTLIATNVTLLERMFLSILTITFKCY